MTYLEVKGMAMALANASGADYGIESLGGEWRKFRLPASAFRTGHELRCEVVTCSYWDVILPGHGGKP